MSNNQTSSTPVSSPGQTKTVAFADIDLDAAKMRKELDESAVERYAERYKLGEPMDPPKLVAVGGRYLVGDAWHRIAAMQSLDWSQGEFVVVEGTEADAVDIAAASQLGVPRSRADRRLAVEWMIDHHTDRSNRDVAGRCGVSPTTVGTYRAEMEKKGDVSPTPTRRGRDGKDRVGPKKAPTVQIGQLLQPGQPGLSLVDDDVKVKIAALTARAKTAEARVKELERATKPVLRLLALLDADTVEEAIETLTEENRAAA